MTRKCCGIKCPAQVKNTGSKVKFNSTKQRSGNIGQLRTLTSPDSTIRMRSIDNTATSGSFGFINDLEQYVATDVFPQTFTFMPGDEL
jgi:hypothetical protein